MRTLVLNDFLADWTGSEIVALEVAQHFGATSSSFWCADPMKSQLDDWRPLDEIDLSQFDLVWAQQHTVFPLLDKMTEGSKRPWIVWASLSPYEPMENIPRPLLGAYADAVLANSKETAEARAVDSYFGNAAPNSFHFVRERRDLRNILFVSNNQPPEMVEAEQLLSARGYGTRFLGRNKEYKLLEPSDMEWADCVVTIGKTARYALASNTPVFVYDRFGGGGYVNSANFESNEANNFSGRPGCRKLTAEQIASEIVERHCNWIAPIQPKLGDFLDDVAARAARQEFIRHPDLTAVADMSSAIGAWLAEAYRLRLVEQNFHSGKVGWRSLLKIARRKLLDV